MKTTTVTVRVSGATHNALTRRAEEAGTSIADQIRRAIDQALSDQDQADRFGALEARIRQMIDAQTQRLIDELMEEE